MKNIDLSIFDGKKVPFLIKKAEELFKENLEGKIHAHKIYTTILDQVPIKYDDQEGLHFLRGNLRQKIWECERSFFWNDRYYSQAGQDKIINKTFFDGKKNRFFIEIGAHDGISGSNCYYFERFLNWNGIAIEPSNIQFEKLKKNRKCKILNNAISDEVKEVEFVEVIEGLTQLSGIKNSLSKKNFDIISNDKSIKTKSFNIKTITFDDIVPKDTEIDYLSIDIEGGEMNLLKSINFDIINIKVISVENNIPKEQNFKNFLETRNFNYFDRIGQDEIFYNNQYFKF